MKAAAIEVDISFGSPKWRGRKAWTALAQRALDAAAAAGKKAGAVAVRFTSDEEVAEVNQTWRGKGRPTNVLSFPAPRAPAAPGGRAFLGDVILAYETIAAEAAADGKTPADHAAHLIVHGFLHLTGYDHVTAKDASQMERLEIKVLAKLGISNPYQAAKQ